MEAIRKYPRTHHLRGSRLQPGDEDMNAVPFKDIRDSYLVVEEKVDGANAGLSFGPDGKLYLQSRGHYLTGGGREKHFTLFKKWAFAHEYRLRDIIGQRYLVYGEWLQAKHTVFYDALPHFFLEFDVFDRHTETFLSTERRHELFAGTPVVSVPVLWRGQTRTLGHLQGLVQHSLYKTPGWRERLRQVAEERGLDAERVRAETDSHDEMEGLYIKVESEGQVVGRYKYVRASFLTSILESGSHWLSRPIVPNQLAADVDIFA